MVTKEGIPKLCDLGLAKAVDTDMSLTRTGIVMGTPHYISPEQAVGQKDLDIRSDIYSLGVTFYHMLTGEVPYKGTTVISIISQHLSGPLPALKEKNHKLSDEICKIIYTMMAKKREERYQTAQELLVDLKRFLRKEQPFGVDKEKEIVKNEMSTTRRSSENQKLTPEEIEEDKKTREMFELVSAATIGMNEEITSMALKEAAKKEDDSQVSKKEENAQSKDSQKLAEELEKRIKSTPKSSKLKKIAVIFFLLVFAGVCGTGYYHKDKLEEYKKKLGEFSERVFHTSKENLEPDTKLLYKAWDEAQKKENDFKEFSDKIKVKDKEYKVLTENMALISGGNYTMGASGGDTDEEPHQANISSFWIDRYEVSNKEYCEFCSETGYTFPPGLPEGLSKKSVPNYPVTNITFYDASLYAKWAGKRLPTESEWEFAAKSTNNFKYPWGMEYLKDCANVESGRVEEVTSFPKGRTSTGIYNMAGNVWEWTSSLYDYSESKGNKQDYVIRGGSYSYSPYYARTTYREALLAYGKREDLGFRCALDHK